MEGVVFFRTERVTIIMRHTGSVASLKYLSEKSLKMSSCLFNTKLDQLKDKASCHLILKFVAWCVTDIGWGGVDWIHLA
jgi:hypothetical protein